MVAQFLDELLHRVLPVRLLHPLLLDQVSEMDRWMCDDGLTQRLVWVGPRLDLQDATSVFLYFGYTFIMVFLFFLLSGRFPSVELFFLVLRSQRCPCVAGTIGFFACFWFVRKIYSVVKVD